ncbi:hypothetical protein ACB098_11G113400 [Castanea mollissima]
MSQTTEPPILRRRKNDLPDDIVLNILTRLPAKSVIRFRIAIWIRSVIIYNSSCDE